MTPSPIRRVLSTLRSHRVQCLLMGGQACILYGAAEFSRDTDIALLGDAANLQRLQSALQDLHADRIAVPPFEAEYLHRGHAVHFRCQHPDAEGMRLDVMAVMRGVAPFGVLWNRRSTVDVDDGESIDLLSLPDLVQSKKTQRDRDWPMIRRLIEADFVQHQDRTTGERVGFWLREARTPELLVTVARRFPDSAAALMVDRPMLRLAVEDRQEALAGALEAEAAAEREADRRYWAPLRAELERLRHERLP